MTTSVVIPTLGRASLYRAVQSALAQTEPVAQVVIVADTDRVMHHPADDRITLVRNSSPVGAAGSRQRGIDASTGSVIALLDDDDEEPDSASGHRSRPVEGESLSAFRFFPAC